MQGLKEKLATFLLIIVNGSCFILAFYMSQRSLNLYFNERTSTAIQLHQTEKVNLFPAITICSDPETRWNEKMLKFCGIDSSESYYQGAQWSGTTADNQTCSDPKKLYKAVTMELKDMIGYLKFIYLSKTKPEETFLTDDSSVWSVIGHKTRGRCYTITPTEIMIKHGIVQIDLEVLNGIVMYSHTPGMFITSQQKANLQIPANKKRRRIQVDLEHEIYYMLDYGGHKCKPPQQGLTYSWDNCTLESFDKNANNQFGCTVPFRFGKGNICKDSKIGKVALKDYTEHIDATKRHRTNCLAPCGFVKTKAIMTRDFELDEDIVKNDTILQIYFDDYIKITEEYPTFTFLQMIAQVGGYVGLFLGWSFNQVINPLVFWLKH